MGAVSSLLRRSATASGVKELSQSVSRSSSTGANRTHHASGVAGPGPSAVAKSRQTESESGHTSKIVKTDRRAPSEADEELRRKMAGIAGDGGDAGLEYEGGQPVSMKRGVKKNMFRYI